MEMISAIVYQLTRNLTPEQILEGGFAPYFVDHTTGIYPQAASGTPWSAMTIQSVGDPLTDLFEDLAAEQKARTTYDNLLRLIDDPDVRDPLKFLRAREVVHFQRFGDALTVAQRHLDAKNYYAFNPAMDVRVSGRPVMPQRPNQWQDNTQNAGQGQRQNNTQNAGQGQWMSDQMAPPEMQPPVS